MKPKQFRIVEWTNAYCTLRFKTAQPPGEPLDFTQLLQFRKAITRSKRCLRGWVPDPEKDLTHDGEGFNEVKGLIILVVTGHADLIRVQPLELEYEWGGETVHYYPDFLVIWGDEIWIVEVKPDRQADRDAERFEHLKNLFASHRLHFKLWRKSEIIAQPRYENARRLIRYQICTISFTDHERMRLTFAETPEIQLGALDDCDGRKALKLVIEGMLHIDWWSKLSRHSIVSVWPVGRQEWPNDHTADTEPCIAHGGADHGQA